MKITHVTAGLSAALGLLLAQPASAVENLFADVDMNGPPPGCLIPPSPFFSNTDGTSLGLSCGDNTRVGGAAAVVTHGRVGAATNATDVTVGMGTRAEAFWEQTDFLIQGAPGQTGTTPVSLNFVFEGSFGGFAAPTSNTTVDVTLELNADVFAAFIQHTDTGDNCQNFGPIDFCSHFNGSVTLGTVFTTPIVNLPVNAPFLLGYVLVLTSTAIGPAASTNGEFINTLGFAPGVPVMNFTEPGLTVNEGDYIVDNAYIEPVDEPAAALLLAFGLCGLMLHRRAAR